MTELDNVLENEPSYITLNAAQQRLISEIKHVAEPSIFQRMRHHGQIPLIIIQGFSGVGKTSVIENPSLTKTLQGWIIDPPDAEILTHISKGENVLVARPPDHDCSLDFVSHTMNIHKALEMSGRSYSGYAAKTLYLGGFNRGEVRQYLINKNITDEKRIHELSYLTGGIPLLLQRLSGIPYKDVSELYSHIVTYFDTQLGNFYEKLTSRSNSYVSKDVIDEVPQVYLDYLREALEHRFNVKVEQNIVRGFEQYNQNSANRLETPTHEMIVDYLEQFGCGYSVSFNPAFIVASGITPKQLKTIRNIFNEAFGVKGPDTSENVFGITPDRQTIIDITDNKNQQPTVVFSGTRGNLKPERKVINYLTQLVSVVDESNDKRTIFCDCTTHPRLANSFISMILLESMFQTLEAKYIRATQTIDSESKLQSWGRVFSPENKSYKKIELPTDLFYNKKDSD